ncbi:hypothetical protein BH18ACI2_BH18ACI2_23380 [soil metagenome]
MLRGLTLIFDAPIHNAKTDRQGERIFLEAPDTRAASLLTACACRNTTTIGSSARFTNAD